MSKIKKTQKMKEKWLNSYLNLFFCMALSVLSSSVLLCNHFKFSSKKISNGSSPVSAPLFIFSFSSPPAAVFESQYEVLVLSLRNVYSHVFIFWHQKPKKGYFVSKIVLIYCEKKNVPVIEIRGWRPRICNFFEIIGTIYWHNQNNFG